VTSRSTVWDARTPIARTPRRRWTRSTGAGGRTLEVLEQGVGMPRTPAGPGPPDPREAQSAIDVGFTGRIQGPCASARPNQTVLGARSEPSRACGGRKAAGSSRSSSRGARDPRSGGLHPRRRHDALGETGLPTVSTCAPGHRGSGPHRRPAGTSVKACATSTGEEPPFVPCPAEGGRGGPSHRCRRGDSAIRVDHQPTGH